VRGAGEFGAAAATSSEIASSSSSDAAGTSLPHEQQQEHEHEQEQQQEQEQEKGEEGEGASRSNVAPEVRSFDLDLPPSSSGSTGLDALDDVQLQQQAQVRPCGPPCPTPPILAQPVQLAAETPARLPPLAPAVCDRLTPGAHHQ
jgi:hypothetical protein